MRLVFCATYERQLRATDRSPPTLLQSSSGCIHEVFRQRDLEWRKSANAPVAVSIKAAFAQPTADESDCPLLWPVLGAGFRAALLLCGRVRGRRGPGEDPLGGVGEEAASCARCCFRRHMRTFMQAHASTPDAARDFRYIMSTIATLLKEEILASSISFLFVESLAF